MAIDRYCQDCNQLSDETSWSDHYRIRLCMDCYNQRSHDEAFECGVIPHGGPTEQDPDRPYCKDDQSCCDFCCGN